MMATKGARQRKWEASLRLYVRAGDYNVWRVGYRARNADQEFLVYPASSTADDIQSLSARPIFRATTYAKLLAQWNNPASWARS